MKMSQLFGQTLRDAPTDTSTSLSTGTEVSRHQLLMRIHPSARGGQCIIAPRGER